MAFARSTRLRLALCSLVASAVAFAATTATSPAHAAFTSSEKVQVRTWYSEADVDEAGQFRALLARTDHTEEDVTAAFADAVVGPIFDAQRHAFLDKVLFGNASDASRSDLAPPILKGLLQRAERLNKDGELESAQFREVLRIHRFAIQRLAPSAQGTGAAGLREDAVEALTKAYRDYLASEALAPDNLPSKALLARRQADLALAAIADGRTPRSEIASWLGVPGREAVFAQHGWLQFGDPASGSQPAIEAWVGGLLGAQSRPAALSFGNERPSGLVAPGGLVHVFAQPHASGSAPGGDCVSRTSLAETAIAVALASAERRLAQDEAFADRAARIAEDASSHRAFAAPEIAASLWERSSGEAPVSPWLMLGATTRRLLLDADAALLFALSEAQAGRIGPAQQINLALELLASEEATLLGACAKGEATLLESPAPIRTGARITSLQRGDATYTWSFDAGKLVGMKLAAADEDAGDDQDP